jgi:hypothetical protein
MDSGFTGFTGFTPEQKRRIRKLVDEGMSEKLAREEVLGKGWVEFTAPPSSSLPSESSTQGVRNSSTTSRGSLCTFSTP